MSGINTTYSAYQVTNHPDLLQITSFANEIPLSPVRTIGHYGTHTNKYTLHVCIFILLGMLVSILNSG